MASGNDSQKKHSGTTAGTKLVWALIASVALALVAFFALRDTVTQQPSTQAQQEQSGSNSLSGAVDMSKSTEGSAEDGGTSGTTGDTSGDVSGDQSGNSAGSSQGTTPDTAEKSVADQKTDNARAAAQGKETVSGSQQSDQGATPVKQQVTEDSVVRLSFIEDLAHTFVKGYYPQGTHPDATDGPIVLTGPKALNMRYGIEMVGLSWAGDDLKHGRSKVLRYAMNPTMMEALYKLYLGRFIEAMDNEADKARRDGNALTDWQKREMYSLYASQLQGVAGVLRACKRMDGSMQRVDAWLASGRAALDSNTRFQETLHEYQLSSNNNAPAAQVAEAKRVMDAAGKAYQQSILQRERVRESLLNNFRRYKWVKQLEDESIVYVANWVYRRTLDNPQALDGAYKAHELLLDMSDRFKTKAGQ